MKKYLIILIVSALCLVAVSFGIIIWWDLSAWIENQKIQEIVNGQKALPIVKTSGTATAYGIEMPSYCFTELQGFLKDYNPDYSKCLADFNFNDEYCGGFDPDTQGLFDVNIIVILDSSGSMADKIDAGAKIDVAKRAVSDLLTKIPKGVNTGLIVYGHKGSNSTADKTLSCQGIEEVVKLGANNSSNIISAMDSFSPKGWTPIAGSLDFAKDIFKKMGTADKNYLILVSDGVESCDGDPLASAKNLKSEIPGIKLNVIGFTTDTKTRNFLGEITNKAGGSYLTASNSSDIAKAFNDELLVIKEDCLSVTLFQMYSRNNANNVANLNCWLGTYKKESEDFDANVSGKSFDEECGSKISDALQVRRNDFWYKKDVLVQKNDAIYKNIQTDFNSQFKALENLKSKKY